MTTVAMLTSTAFWRRSRGSERRIADLTRAIAGAGHAVTVIWAGRLSEEDRAAIERERVSVEQTGIGLPSAPPNAPLAAFGGGLFEEALAGAIARTRPDVLVAQYIRFAPAIGAMPPDLRPPTCLVDTHDVMHTRAKAFHEAGHDHWIDLTRDEEAAALGAFDAVLAINSVDASVLGQMTGVGRVMTVPHAVELTETDGAPGGPPNALFVGAAGTPNVDAAAWLIDDLWADARPRLPAGSTLTIAGAVCDALTDAQRSAPGVRAVGFADDLRPLYAEATVTIVPLRFGGGLKIKNVESLAHGVPVVTTPVGAQGMEPAVGSAVLVADHRAGLAEALVRACTDEHLNRSMRRSAGAFVAERFSPSAAYRPLLSMLGAARGVAA